jgi:hypothetical protein
MQEGLGPTLRDEDFMLLGVCYRHGNIGGVGVEALDKRRPFARGGYLQGVGVVLQCVSWGDCQAMPFPLQ